MIPYCKICKQKMSAFSFNTEKAEWKFPTTTYECKICRSQPSEKSPSRSRYYCTINIRNNNIVQEKFFREKDDYFFYIIKSAGFNYIEVKKSILGQPIRHLMYLPNNDLNYHQMFDKVEKLLPFL